MAGKYREYQSNRRTSQQDYRKVHPIWRGIGFAFMVLIPLISYAACEVALQQNGLHHWFPIPVDMIIGPGNFLYTVTKDSYFLIKIFLTVVFMILFYVVILFLFSIVNGFLGVSNRKDPYYVPPIERQSRRRR